MQRHFFKRLQQLIFDIKIDRDFPKLRIKPEILIF